MCIRDSLVVDNVSTHKTPEIKKWLLRHPRFHLHFTPTYSSWMNLVERWSPNSPTSGSAEERTDQPKSSSRRSPTGSTTGMTSPSPSSGTRAPMRSSTHWLTTARGSLTQVTSRPQAVSSAFVTAGQPTSGDHRCGEGGEEGSGPCSMEFGGVRGVAHLARESEDLERVAVWSVAFDRLGAVVAPTDGGSQDPHPGGGFFCRQSAWG